MEQHKPKGARNPLVILTLALGMAIAIIGVGIPTQTGASWILEAHAVSSDSIERDPSEASPPPVQSEAIPCQSEAFSRTDYRTSAEMTFASRILAEGLAQEQPVIDVSEAQVNKQFIADIYHSVLDEDPRLWYVYGNGTFVSDADGMVLTVSPSYMSDSPEAIMLMRDAYEEAMEEIVSDMPEDAMEMDKIRILHDRIIDRCSYNHDCAKNPDSYAVTLSDNPYGAYATIVLRQSVCRGYALAFKDACSRVGIECEVTRTSPHEWNKVLHNGHWYNVDLTFDDLGDDKGHSYALFMKSDEYLRCYDVLHTSDSPHANPFPDGFPCDDSTYDSLGMGVLRIFM